MPRDKEAILQELLVLRCKRGENRAFEELIRLWEGRLLYYIRRLVATEEDAWDILQQTWMKVFKSIKTLNSPQRLSTWLYQIARNTALSHWRGRYRAEARMEIHGDAMEAEAPEASCRFDDAEQVHQALARVTLDHREVLTLFFLQDLTLDQIAEVLGIPSGTAKSRLFYAKRALRAVLERQEGNP